MNTTSSPSAIATCVRVIEVAHDYSLQERVEDAIASKALTERLRRYREKGWMIDPILLSKPGDVAP